MNTRSNEQDRGGVALKWGGYGKSNRYNVAKRHKCIITMKSLKLQLKQRDLTRLGHLVGK